MDATASVDCAGPVISGVTASAITDRVATITWTTDELANSKITFGPSLPPTNTAQELTTYVTGHSLAAGGLSPCTTYYYSVTSADRAGNPTTDDQNGAYYTFTTEGRSFGFGPDHVEGGAGSWIATSNGATVWHIDTCRAFSGTHAWKIGAATCPGQYDNSTAADLTSPAIDLGNPGHGYFLRWAQWFSTEAYRDTCTVQISSNDGVIWGNLTLGFSGFSNGWQTKEADLASYTGPVKFRFHFTSDSATQGEGWYVDDVDVSHADDCQGLPCILTCGATVPATAIIATPVSFQGSATATNCAGIPAYAWSFGDGSTSTQNEPTHTYAAAGTYGWSLTTTVEQQICTKTGSISIVPPCIMTCTATVKPNSGSAPLHVTFSATATATNCGQGTMAYYWDFGDGQTSIQKNTSHDYLAAGTYTWTLSAVTNGNVCGKTGTVTVTAPCAVTCAGTAAPSSGAAPLAVAFTATATPQNCAGSPSFAWVFGDGGTSTQQNPAHTYANSGTYDWTLTVTVGGTTCSKTGTVAVSEPCAVSCTATAPADGLAGHPVSFQGRATATNCAGSPAYAWAFGDGGTSTTQNPAHTYAAAGTYNWTLMVTADGKTCTKGGTITIGEPCALTCSATAPGSGVAGIPASFQATATASHCTGAPAFAWAFGDGATSSEQNPGHTYATAGNFAWTLTVTADDQTCTQTGTVAVSEPCALTCAASATPTAGVAPLVVAFTATATATHCTGTTAFAWVFGDGANSTEQNPSHTYASAGSFTWVLTASVEGKTCTQTGTVLVTAPCTVACTATATPDQGNAPLAVAFASTVTQENCAGDPAYAWAFGDGAASAEANPSHTYTAVGTYTWTLTVAMGGKTCAKTGIITVNSGLPGDGNGDGVVSIGEVQQAINMFLGTQPPGNGVDCNADGVVSIGEVQRVINAFLGLPASC